MFFFSHLSSNKTNGDIIGCLQKHSNQYKMYIQNLRNIDLEDIIFAILMAFEEYFVTMPSDVVYWENRFKCARVNFEYSYGMFDGEQLIGFIINGIDERNNKQVAFNTGTGVIAKYRGQKIIDQLYEYALPKFKNKEISHCLLEVIQENYRAIRVYQRIGFSIVKNYLCFKGKLPVSSYETTIKQVALSEIQNFQEHTYAWDNCNAALNVNPTTYEAYEVMKQGQAKIGFFVINLVSGILHQCEVYAVKKSEHWDLLFDGIAQINRVIRIINLPDTSTNLHQKLLAMEMENDINQYEMEWEIV